MKKIMFNTQYGVEQAALKGYKTKERRIIPKEFFALQWDVRGDTLVYENDYGEFIDIRKSKYNRYKLGEVVAIAQSYESLGMNPELALNDRDGIGFYTKTKFAPGWKNKMFVRADKMPHHIRITNVRLEKLQDISDEDCIKEGIYSYYYGDVEEKKRYDIPPNGYSFDGIDCHYPTTREAYAALIDKVSGKGTWDSNPYVFAYEFELIK